MGDAVRIFEQLDTNCDGRLSPDELMHDQDDAQLQTQIRLFTRKLPKQVSTSVPPTSVAACLEYSAGDRNRAAVCQHLR